MNKLLTALALLTPLSAIANPNLIVSEPFIPGYSSEGNCSIVWDNKLSGYISHGGVHGDVQLDFDGGGVTRFLVCNTPISEALTFTTDECFVGQRDFSFLISNKTVSQSEQDKWDSTHMTSLDNAVPQITHTDINGETKVITVNLEDNTVEGDTDILSVTEVGSWTKISYTLPSTYTTVEIKDVADLSGGLSTIPFVITGGLVDDNFTSCTIMDRTVDPAVVEPVNPDPVDPDEYELNTGVGSFNLITLFFLTLLGSHGLIRSKLTK